MSDEMKKQELQELNLKENALRELKTAKMVLVTEDCFVNCERIINDYNDFNSFMFKFSCVIDVARSVPP